MGRQTMVFICPSLSIAPWGAHAGEALSGPPGPDIRGHAAWQPVGPAPPAVEAAIAADPFSHTFYGCCMGGGVLKSIDGSASFRPKSAGLPIGEEPANTGFRLVNPGHPKVLYVGGEISGVFKSTDAAATWFPINCGLSDTGIITALAMDSNAPDTVNAATYYRSVYKTVTGGRWLHLAANR